jgi:hypothetical protein
MDTYHFAGRRKYKYLDFVLIKFQIYMHILNNSFGM